MPRSIRTQWQYRAFKNSLRAKCNAQLEHPDNTGHSSTAVWEQNATPSQDRLTIQAKNSRLTAKCYAQSEHSDNTGHSRTAWEQSATHNQNTLTISTGQEQQTDSTVPRLVRTHWQYRAGITNWDQRGTFGTLTSNHGNSSIKCYIQKTDDERRQ